MKITFLDADTLGSDLIEKIRQTFDTMGDVEIRGTTTPDEVENAISDSDIVAINKIKLDESNLKNAHKLKLILIAATGYDNVDVKWCGKNNIAVCNVKDYSTHSVAQLTVAMALMLINKMNEYTSYVSSGAYSKSGVANRLEPVYHEICGKTWGIVGAGNIGRQVMKVAEALGCRVVVNKRKDDKNLKCVDIDTLCKESDIISIHTPLTDATRNIINKERIAMMKKDAIFINVARGAVADEAALAEAIKENRLGGIGIDVFTTEPMPKNHPFFEIANDSRVCLTPHNAWGAYEARVRCIEIMKQNAEVFFNGGRQNRVDI